jgi:hypothetical protein
MEGWNDHKDEAQVMCASRHRAAGIEPREGLCGEVKDLVATAGIHTASGQEQTKLNETSKNPSRRRRSDGSPCAAPSTRSLSAHRNRQLPIRNKDGSFFEADFERHVNKVLRKHKSNVEYSIFFPPSTHHSEVSDRNKVVAIIRTPAPVDTSHANFSPTGSSRSPGYPRGIP